MKYSLATGIFLIVYQIFILNSNNHDAILRYLGL